MIKFKKVIATMCSIAMIVAAACISTVSVSADTVYSYSLETDTSRTYDSDMQENYLLLKIAGFTRGNDTTSYTNGGTVKFAVTKGVIDEIDTDSYTVYMKNDNGRKKPAISVTLSTAAAEYDTLTINWAAQEDVGFKAEEDKVVAFGFWYKNDVEATFTPLIDDKVVMQVCASDGTNPVGNVPTASGYEYKLAADSTAVTAVKIGGDEPTDPWVDADAGTNYTGEYDNSKAAAYTVELTGDGTNYDEITWKATKGSETKGHVTALGQSLGGTGTFKFGIAIGGVTTSDLSDVKAAWGNQTPSAE